VSSIEIIRRPKVETRERTPSVSEDISTESFTIFKPKIEPDPREPVESKDKTIVQSKTASEAKAPPRRILPAPGKTMPESAVLTKTSSPTKPSQPQQQATTSMARPSQAVVIKNPTFKTPRIQSAGKTMPEDTSSRKEPTKDSSSSLSSDTQSSKNPIVIKPKQDRPVPTTPNKETKKPISLNRPKAIISEPSTSKKALTQIEEARNTNPVSHHVTKPSTSKAESKVNQDHLYASILGPESKNTSNIMKIPKKQPEPVMRTSKSTKQVTSPISSDEELPRI
jgi:hypothetical protein